MKLGILSDIHVDLNYEENDPVEEALVQSITEQGIDYMIIAGDISNDYQITLQTLEQLQNETGAKCIFVPGNHDLWNINHSHTSTYEICSKLGTFDGNLSNGPIHLNKQWVVIGDTGWYDYSFGSKQFTLEHFLLGSHMDRHWKDKEYVRWDECDQERSNHYFEKLKKQIEENRDKNIIWVTHMVPHSYFIVQDPDPLWAYFNGFLGSKEYGKLIERYHIPYAIFGHVHYRKQAKIKNTQYICSCLNYRTQWMQTQEAKKEIEEALTIIEI